MQRYRVAVIGLGALGSATAYQLARRGVSVIGFEQFALGHVRGASHDTSRILRRSYHLPEYVQLADSAYRDWRDLEDFAREKFVTTTGSLTFCPADSPIGVKMYSESLLSQQVPFRVLDKRELHSRYPQFRMPADVLAIAQDEGAVVPAGRTTAVLQVLARFQGATLRAECRVLAIEPQSGGGVSIRTETDTVQADTVVLCADAWTNKLLGPLGFALPLVSTLEQVSYFAPEDPGSFAPGRFPVWIWDDDPCYYGFPCYGEPFIKTARDSSGIEFDIDERSFEPVPERLTELAAFTDGLLPGKGRHVRTITCQYTLTPDRDFVLGPVPGHPQILVGLGAGHAFKFTPTIGRVLADLATSGSSNEDLSLFGMDRQALCRPDVVPESVLVGTEPLGSAWGAS